MTLLRTLKASDWQHYIPQGDDDRQIFVELAPEVSTLDLEILSANSVTVNLITKDGETLWVASGKHVKVNLKVIGFAAFEIQTNGLFSYKHATKFKWYEKLDPRPMAVTVDQPSKQPLLDMMRAELDAYMRRQKLSEELRNGVSVDELIDDIENGDLDFEPDIDEFGLSAIDMSDDHLQEQSSAEGSSAPPEQPPGPDNAAEPAADPTST